MYYVCSSTLCTALRHQHHWCFHVDTKQCTPHLSFTVVTSMTPQASIQTSVQTSVRSQDLHTSRTVSDDVSACEGTSVSPRPSSSPQSDGSQKPPFGCGFGIQKLM